MALDLKYDPNWKPSKGADELDLTYDPGWKAPTPTPKGFMGHARDLGISALQGAIGVPEAAVGLADIATGGQAGKLLENEGGPFGFRPKQAREFLDTLKTDTTQQQKKAFEQADGIAGKTAYALQNPSLVANAVVESAPMMGFGGVIGRGVIAAAPKVGAAMAGAVGEGVAAAGSSAEKIRQETADGTLTAGQSGLAAAAGVATAGFGALGAKVAQRLGIADADTLMVQGAKGLTGQAAQQAAVKGIPRKVIEGAIAEGFLEELPQSVSEQVLQNIALNKDWSEGVDSAVVLGVLSGMAMGGGAAGLQGASQSRAAAGAPQETPAAETDLLALPAPTYAGTPSDQILQAETDRANAVAQAEARAAGIYQQRAEFDAARQGEPAAPMANPGLELVRQAYAAQLDAIQQQEQGDPAVAQSTPPDGRAVLDAQAAQAQAGREAALAASRGMASPDDEIFQSTGAMEPPHRALGIDPAAGPLSAGAAIAVDTGVAGQMQAAAQTGNLAGAAQMATGGPAPAIHQAQAANPAGLAWNGMSPAKRAEVAGAIQGLPQVVARNVPNVGWESINPELQGRIASAMASNQPQQAAISAPAADMAGGQIDKEWSAFAPETGTLAVPRSEMPQIKAEHRGAMTNFMNARGVSHAAEEVPADSLRPTQAEFSPGKVKKAMGFTGGDRSILISADNYVLDGHHQWLAKREAGEPVKVIRLNAPIADLIPLAREFPSSTTAGGSASEVVTNPATLVEKSPQNAQIQPETPAAAGAAGGGQSGESASPALGQALKILMDRTDGIGAPDGLGGPEHADARTAIISALTGERAADIEAAPNFKFRTSVPQVERLLYDAAGIPAGKTLKDRRSPFLDWLDQQQAGGVAQPTAELTARVEALDREMERKLQEAEAGLRFSRGGSQAGEFVAAPDGSIDFGEITPEMAQAMRRQAGKIRLERGDDSYGERHIEMRHGEDIRRLGFSGVRDFVAGIARNIDQVWKAERTPQLVAIHELKNDRLMFVELRAARDEAGDYYTVRSAFPARKGFVKNKGWELLWEDGRAQPSTNASSSAPFAVPASEVTGEPATIPSGQSSDLSVANPDADGTPKVQRSASAAATPSGITAESLPGIFAERFPKLSSAIRTMLDRGALGQKGGLVVLDSNDEAQIAREFADRTGRSFDDTVQMFAGAGEDINAFYDPESGLTFMVGPNLSAESLPAVVLHEMVHGQQRQALDQKALALIDGRAKQAPALRAFLDRVAERMEAVGETGNPFEATSYIVEMAVQEGRQSGFSRADGPILAWIERNIGRKVADLVRDFVAMTRAWALSHGVTLKSIAVDDLVAYAMAGVGKAARGRVVTNEGASSLSQRQRVSPENLPDAFVANPLGAAAGPDHDAAKAGDREAALRLARKLVTPELLDHVRKVAPKDAVVVGVASIEATGRNALPETAATLIAQRLGLDLDPAILQANRPKRTAMDGLDRVFVQAEFDGPIEPGKSYVLVDDTLTQGGTFAALASHIEQNGGRVAAVVALTGKQYSSRLSPDSSLIQQLRNTHGDVESSFERATGYGFDGLTASEARYLANFKPADAVRARILAAVEAGDPGLGDGAAGPRFSRRGDTEGLNQAAPESARRAAGATDRLREASARAAGRPRPDPNDPFSAENTRLREHDKSLWQKAKGQLRRWLAPGGLLPESVFAEKIKRDSEFQAVEFDIRHIVGGFEQAVKQDFGVPFDKLTQAQQRTLSEALAGKVAGNLPEATKTAVVAMRQYIDTLSGEYLQIIQGRIDALMARAQETGNVGAASRAINEIELYEKIRNNVGAYVHRSYQAFDDPKWFQKVPTATLNAARQYLKDGYMEGGKTSEAEALRLTEVALNEILKNGTAYDSMEAFISEGKLGAKDLSVLMRRKDVPPVIRALLGEYTDPRLNFTKSATKMGRLIWNQRFLDRVRDMGLGTFLFEGKDRPPMATTQIAAQGSEVYAPLNGLWTFPEVAQAFKDALGKEQMGDLYRFIVRANGLVKYGKTVLSPTTAMRNWQSAMFFALANGHFDLTQMKKSVAAFREQVRQNATDGDLAYLRHLKELGVVYDTPYAGEMMRFIEDAKADNGVDTVMRAFGASDGAIAKGLRGVKQINQVAQGFYSFGDDFWKIIGFENEKAGLLKAGLPLAEAEREAAKRIRDTYPTYSMVGAGIQKLSRFPLMGTFVSFPAEIVRTSANMLRTTAADLKSDNPALRALGMKRAVGMSVVSGLFYALAALSKSASGVDDDEEEALRDLAPEWQKNSTFLFAGRNEKGQLRYFDMSFLDPYGYWKRPITAMLRDQPWEKSAASALKDMLTPFFGADIATAAIFQAVANKKDSGGKVYQEGADAIDQAGAIANHLRKALQPGFVGNIERLTLAAQGVRREGSGQPYDLNDEMTALLGWRASTMDPKTALYYRSFEFNDAMTEAKQVLTRTLRSVNPVSQEDIRDARGVAQSRQAEAFTEMRRLVQAAQAAGMNPMQIRQVLKQSSISQANAEALMRGTPPRLVLTVPAVAKAVQQARAMEGPEFAQEVARRYRMASGM